MNAREEAIEKAAERLRFIFSLSSAAFDPEYPIPGLASTPESLAETVLSAALASGVVVLRDDLIELPNYAAHAPTEDGPDWYIEEDLQLPQGQWMPVFILRGED